MKGNVNPFEPWRPVEARIPRPIHASRPWRPPPPPPARAAVEEPPFVEPVQPQRRNKTPERPPRPKQPPRRTEESSRAWAPLSKLAAVWVLALLALICFENVGWLRGSHMPRLVALGAGAGLLAGMALNARRSWHSRLSWMAAALAWTGIAAWFVPTVHCVSLWSAYQQVAELRALPAGDVAAYQHGAASRQTLVEDFPSLEADVSAAERAWFRRTVDEAIENADQLLERDPQTAFGNLHRLKTQLEGLKQYSSVRKELEDARQRAMLASAKVVQQR